MKRLGYFCLLLLLSHATWAAPADQLDEDFPTTNSELIDPPKATATSPVRIPPLGRLDSAFSIDTSDWIDPAKATDTLQARISVRAIALGVYRARYVSEQDLSKGDAARDFTKFNTCLGEQLAELSGKAFWQLGFDSNQLKQDRLDHPPDVYFMLMDSRLTRYKAIKGYPITWQDQPPISSGTFKHLCSDYLQDPLAVMAGD